MVHVLEPACVRHVKVEWRLNRVQPKEEFVHLVRVVGLFELAERLVHLVVGHSSQLLTDLLENTILSYLFVLYLSLRSRTTEAEELVNLEAGEAPENQVHARQISIVSLEPLEGEYGLARQVVLCVLFVTIVKENERTHIGQLLRDLRSLLELAANKGPVPIWHSINLDSFLLHINKLIMQFELQRNRLVLLEFLQ